MKGNNKGQIMKLSDQTKRISAMSDEELREHVRNIRHNKYVAKPAKVKHIEDSKKATRNTATRNTNKAIEKLSPDEKKQLLKLLSGG